MPHSFARMCSKTVRVVRRNGGSPCSARGAVAALCIIVSSALFQACRERRESFYSSLFEATNSGEITRGWIPGFLPGSSRAIHIIYDPSSPRTWCAFEFSPDDSQRFRDNLTSVDALPPRVRRVGNPGVSWWPDFMKGDLDVGRLHGQGFILYVVVEPDVGSSTRLVLFAIDWATGRGFFYRTPGQ